MQLLRELRTYVSAAASVPILIMLVNPTVAGSLAGYANAFAFQFTILMVSLYIFLWGRGYFVRITNPTTELLAESTILNAPIVYPTITVFLTNRADDFIGVLLAYLTFGAVASVYQIILGKRVGAMQKIVFFVLGYTLALITYAGAFEGQEVKEAFNLVRAFDHVSGGITLIGYVGRTATLPLSSDIRMAMAIAIPSITFSALAAQVRLTEVQENPTGDARMVTSLRPAVALLTFGGAVLLLPALLLSKIIESVPFLVTVIPPLGFALMVLLVIRFSEKKEE